MKNIPHPTGQRLIIINTRKLLNPNNKPKMMKYPHRWEEIGVWNSEKGGKVDIKDIVWPGEALKPPEGVPERGFLTVTFLEVI